jgi:Cu2+-exporting ATPase
MKTSVIEVPDMLSVLTVDEVEKRFGDVPGVESATANYAAGKITVRYDETLLKVADITVFVHQRGQQSEDETPLKDENGKMSDHLSAAASAPRRAPVAATPPAPAGPKADSAPAVSPAATASTAMPKLTAPAAEGQADKPAPGTPSVRAEHA